MKLDQHVLNVLPLAEHAMGTTACHRAAPQQHHVHFCLHPEARQQVATTLISREAAPHKYWLSLRIARIP